MEKVDFILQVCERGGKREKREGGREKRKGEEGGREGEEGGRRGREGGRRGREGGEGGREKREGGREKRKGGRKKREELVKPGIGPRVSVSLYLGEMWFTDCLYNDGSYCMHLRLRKYFTTN